MPEQDQTLNEEVIAPSPIDNPDDLIGTVDESIPASSEETQKTDEEIKEGETNAAEEAEKKEADEKAATQAQEDETRFDKHPRFQELIQSKNDLKDQIKTLQTQVSEGLKSKEPEDPGYKDVSKMTAEEIREWMEEDPIAYTANIAKQIRAEVTKDVEDKFTQRTHEDKVLKTFDDYAAKNETFDAMWDSGEIQRFIDKNPGHNAISAHMALTLEAKAKDIETQIKEAVEKAQKETEERVVKNFKAKKGAQVLSSGPVSTGTVQGKIAPELKTPKKFGGINTVLAARLKERRQAA
jgi:hypothetical protein